MPSRRRKSMAPKVLCVSVALCAMNTAAAQRGYDVLPGFPPFPPSAATQAKETTETTKVVTHAEQRVTVVVRDSTVDYTVQAIGRQAHLRLVYDGGNPVFAKRITVHLENVVAMKAFAAVLKGTGLTAALTPDGETVTIHSDTTTRPRASGTISGHVVDSASGRGLNGATVKVQGIKRSTITTDSGSFTLRDVPIGDQVIIVRLFGYRPSTRAVTVTENAPTVVRFALATAPNVLSGVVTTATGQQRRIEVGNDITLLNADSILRVAPIANLTDMLATRVPGLIVQNTSGIPGAPSRIRIRGASSVTTSDDPILIVDGIRVNADQSGNTDNFGTLVYGGGSQLSAPGVTTNGASSTLTYSGPSPLDQIDPNSIETIEVLKGPSATAVYGSDAANGVIVVTTKRGHAGPTRWNLVADAGRSYLSGDWPTFYHTFYRPANGGPTIEEVQGISVNQGDVLVSKIPYQALNDSRISPLGTGNNGDVSLSVRGGNGLLTYAVTGSGSDQTGYLHLPEFVSTAFEATHNFPAPNWMTDPTTYKTYGGNSSLVAQFGRGASLALNSSLFRSAQQQSSLTSGLAGLQFQYVDDSKLDDPVQASALATTLFPNYTTLARFTTTTFTNAVSLTNWTPWPWLPPISATAGLSLSNTAGNTLTPRDYILNNTTDSLGQYSELRGTTETQSFHVSTTLLPGTKLSTAIGLDVTGDAREDYFASTTGLPIGVTVPQTFLYSNNSGPSQNSDHTSTYGWYLQPTFNLRERLFVSPGFRQDGGSATGTTGGLGTFPKVDMSYIAFNRPSSETQFGLSLLRPRLAFGVAGVQPTPGDQLRLLQPDVILTPIDATNSAHLNVLQLQTLGNTQLHPERSREVEGGIDAEFGDQRFSVTLTGYNKMRYDAIMSIPVAPSIAAPRVFFGPAQTFSYSVNVGDVRNTGVEASVSARLIDSRPITWSVNADIAQNHERVTRLNNALPNITTGLGGGYNNRILVGYPLNGIWALPIVSYADADSNGFITSNEIRLGDSTVYLGAPQPNYELTLSTNLGLMNGRVQINTSVDYQNGLTQVLQAGQSASCFGCDITLLMNDPSATFAEQAAFIAVNHQVPGTSFGVIQTVNTLRWNTLSVGYLFPPSVLRALHVPFLSTALQGSNLYLHTNYRGKDPNVNANTSGNLTQDNGQLPRPRTWSVRASIGY